MEILRLILLYRRKGTKKYCPKEVNKISNLPPQDERVNINQNPWTEESSDNKLLPSVYLFNSYKTPSTYNAGNRLEVDGGDEIRTSRSGVSALWYFGLLLYTQIFLKKH